MGNQPITKNISPNSKAWDGYPSKVESCNVPKPFCYFQFDRPITMQCAQYSWCFPTYLTLRTNIYTNKIIRLKVCSINIFD